MLKRVFFLFSFWKILAFASMFLGLYLLPFENSFVTDIEYRRDFPYYIWVWGNFDGYHYMSIAKYGYTYFQHPFFPLYPLLISLFKYLGFHRILGGQTISNLSLVFGLIISYKLFTIDKKRGVFLLFGLILILFPTSFYYGAVYNDSLFFLLATTSLYFARKKSFVLASITGALATLARLNGLALVFPIIFEYLSQGALNPIDTWKINELKKEIIKKVKKTAIIGQKIYFVISIPLVFLGYLIFTEINYETWTKVFSAMSAWEQDKVVFPLQVFWRYIKIIGLFQFSNTVYQVALLELFSVLLYIGMMIYSFKRIRLSYWLFFAFSILIPSLTGTFQGMPRYGLHLYPFFLALTLFLENRSNSTRAIYFVISLLLFFYCLIHFTRGYFIA